MIYRSFCTCGNPCRSSPRLTTRRAHFVVINKGRSIVLTELGNKVALYNPNYLFLELEPAHSC